MQRESDIRIGLATALVVIATTSGIGARAPLRTPMQARSDAAGATLHVVLERQGTYQLPRALQPMVFAAMQDSIVSLALSQLGMPYVLGGTTPGGFDCSGLVQWVTEQVHMPMPRTARLQALAGTPVQRDALQPGDLLAFGDDKRISHVGIYVGQGRFVHASSAAGRVVVSPLDRRPSRLIRPMRGARRLLASRE